VDKPKDAALLTDDELKWQALAREFAQNILEKDQTTSDQPGSARRLMPELGAAGLIGTLLPTEYGGAGLTLAHNTVIQEVLSGAAPSLAAMRAVSAVFVTVPLMRFGTEAQKSRWLPGIAAGESTSAIAFTEPGAGSDLGGMTTVAAQTPSGFTLSGHKWFISGSTEADFILVYAVTAPDAPIERRLSAFLVPTSLAGVDASTGIETMGMRGLSHAQVYFNEARLSQEHLLGEIGQGYEIVNYGLAPERIDIAARAVGCANRAYHEALRYAAQRTQFGRPIRKFQAVSHRLADMCTTVTAARLLVIHAARQFDAGAPCHREAAMAKLYAANQGFKVCDDAMQILGAPGYSKESYPVEMLFRDIRVLRMGGGTDEIMRHIIQREEYLALGELQ
jgi:butyryl-CoA dehydrogenase